MLCVILRQGFPRIIPYPPLGMPFEKAGTGRRQVPLSAQKFMPQLFPLQILRLFRREAKEKKQISLNPLGVENHTQTCFMFPTRLPRRRHQIQPDMFAMPCQKYDL